MKKFVKWFIRVFLCHVIYRVKYINDEILENLDKCLICPNHSNSVEPTWIYVKSENVSIMAKAELFKTKFWAKIFTYFDVFPINRGEHDIRSLIHAINLFKNVEKRKLLVFPEGKRLSKKEARAQAKVGPVYIASKVKVPIVPVYITKNAKLFSKVVIIFGKATTVPEDIVKDKEKLQNFANKIMDDIYDMGDNYYKKEKIK